MRHTNFESFAKLWETRPFQFLGLLGRTVHLKLPLHPEQDPCHQKAQTIEVFTIQLFNDYTNCPKRYTSIPWNPTVYHHFLHQSGSLYLPDKFGEVQKNIQKDYSCYSVFISCFPHFSNSLRAALLRGSAVLSAGFPPPAAKNAATNAGRSEPKICKTRCKTFPKICKIL